MEIYSKPPKFRGGHILNLRNLRPEGKFRKFKIVYRLTSVEKDLRMSRHDGTLLGHGKLNTERYSIHISGWIRVTYGCLRHFY